MSGSALRHAWTRRRDGQPVRAIQWREGAPIAGLHRLSAWLRLSDAEPLVCSDGDGEIGLALVRSGVRLATARPGEWIAVWGDPERPDLEVVAMPDMGR